jgi:probable rRNA maturation factor
MASEEKVRFHFKTACTLKHRRKLKSFLASLFKKQGKPLTALDYIFCTDNELLEINREFLKHDFYTDIITFDLTEGIGITGEVYISTERVKDNARSFETTFEKELLRVIFHGALHLCGYKDKSKAEISEMRQMEERLLKSYGQ